MKRILKVLLPHYKKNEMDKEINDQWLFDCGGRSDLDYSLLSHALFRIAHWWCIHIDYEEYAFLLTKIYLRITCKVIIKSNSRQKVLPNIVVSFPDEEKNMKKDDNEEMEEPEGDDDGGEWVECDEDESPRSDYSYKYGDDNEAMDLKRYKRPKRGIGAKLMAVTHIKEPFLYKEDVEYDLSNLEEGSAVIDQMMGEEYVLPFGYPTEQYLFKLKNDVNEIFSEWKEKNRSDDETKEFIDPGDLKIAGISVEQTFYLFTNNGFYKEYRFVARILDSLYNKIRFAFRE